MAYTSSGELSLSSSYVLGQYTFTLQNVVNEGERVLQAHLTGPGGNAAHGITVPTSTQIKSWCVEANETEATVYATQSDIYEISGGIAVGGSIQTCTQPNNSDKHGGKGTEVNTVTISGGTNTHGIGVMSGYKLDFVVASETPFTGSRNGFTNGYETDHKDFSSHSVNYKGTSIYVITFGTWDSPRPVPSVMTIPKNGSVEQTGLDVIMQNVGSKNILVARFAIDLGNADPDDWDEPGDWNEDPSTVLYVDVVGALSGRHNDPLYDTSYSYIPTDKATVKNYGCGGDGGHGGGGGAGASTVVVHRIATDKANSHEVTALARRHGYGSGGGKGGKGGDGIILIYY